MNIIKLLGRVEHTASESSNDRIVQKLVDDEVKTILAITLKNGAILSKHKASEPITVLCFSGKGEFRAGDGMSESESLEPGTLIAVDANIEHEVRALPNTQIIVTKFKNSD